MVSWKYQKSLMLMRGEVIREAEEVAGPDHSFTDLL
jgi:hypothetical protein